MAGFLGGIKGAFAIAEDKVGNAFDEVSNLRRSIAEQAERFAGEKMEMLRQFEEEKKALLKAHIIGKVEGIYSYAMAVTANYVKEKIKDPYMPGWVMDLCDDLVDTFWPDVSAEVRDLILTGVAPAPVIDHGDRPCPCCGQLIAFFRYWLLPYDRGFWRQIWNPLWLFFNIASLIPKWGIGSAVYILYFLVLDCGDQYQMESYIVEFKALQFLTLGLIATIVGSIQYYVCISKVPMNCDEFAPKEEIWTFIVFVLQELFIWLAFFLLQCGRRKGGFHHMYTEAANASIKERMKHGKGALEGIATSDNFSASIIAELQVKSEDEMGVRSRRRLIKFLLYDLFTFILCMGLVAFAVFKNYLDATSQPDFSEWDTWSNWKLGMTLFWCKALYGLLSFPFAILKIPGLKILVSHSRPTGYNRFGKCVVFLGKEEPEGTCPWHSTYHLHHVEVQPAPQTAWSPPPGHS
jgi:hypothetical protein